MNEIIKVLNSKFVINHITINNFTILNEDLNIEIYLTSDKFGNKKLIFQDVIKLDIDSKNYGCSITSSIMIEDVMELQWEGVFYKIMILEDVMTFYCKKITLE